ncbi:4-hydroxy-tetrahydrodipicolinate reductase [Spirochaeta cellobiosiphila]|uniref:4-hydroxy-tetrahydrodipicolinate reductase n=1 Tax=Spirochaeta cellobiosiphila TaxID=504483 RepID=UPI00048A5CBA|nr:4-hydroxy-tetrahydrodipicolinate reductase [Spirochaeta cellobiosiphila]
MNVVIVGYGQMGHEIEKILIDRGHKIISRIDLHKESADYSELCPEAIEGSDLAIDFSLPTKVMANIKFYGEHRLPVVMGTTGWLDHLEEVKELIESSGSSYIYGSNFSIGAHLFFKMVEKTAALINPVPEYDVMVTEYHHKFKKDSPSGTALTTAQKIIDNVDRKTIIQPEKLDRQIEPQELHVASIRGGNIPGTHKVTVDSLFDTIEVTHTARSRGGFALGAVLAGEWLINKKGFYSVEDFIEQFFD